MYSIETDRKTNGIKRQRRSRDLRLEKKRRALKRLTEYSENTDTDKGRYGTYTRVPK